MQFNKFECNHIKPVPPVYKYSENVISWEMPNKKKASLIKEAFFLFVGLMIYFADFIPLAQFNIVLAETW